MYAFNYRLRNSERSVAPFAPDRLTISEHKYAGLVLKGSSDRVWTELPHDSNLRHGVVTLIEKQ